jgi:hypothetical protein
MEHRWGRRYDTNVAVRFVVLPGRIGSGRVTNISLSGAFLETSDKLRLLTVVYIEGLAAATERGEPAIPKRLAATVVRRSSTGVGLEWCEPLAFPVSELQILAGGTRTSPVQETEVPRAAAALGEPLRLGVNVR